MFGTAVMDKLQEAGIGGVPKAILATSTSQHTDHYTCGKCASGTGLRLI